MPSTFYLEDTYDFLEYRIETLMFSEDENYEDERDQQADHERLADRFNA
jgi:hypothetical protein